MAINEKTSAIAAQIKGNLSIEKGTNIISEKEGTFYSTLPENLTEELVTAVDEHRTIYTAAGTLAAGEIAVEAMKKDAKLTEVKGSLSLGGTTSMNVIVSRSAEYPNPKDHSGEKIVKFGATRTEYDFNGAHGKSGQLKAARAQISELAAQQLKG